MQARLGTSFLLANARRTRSNQIQHKNSFIEAHVASLVKDWQQLSAKEM